MSAERRENFPIETWQRLEAKLSAFRANIMRQAAEIAEKRDTDPAIYTVTHEDVDRALKPVVDALEEKGIKAFERSHVASIS